MASKEDIQGAPTLPLKTTSSLRTSCDACKHMKIRCDKPDSQGSCVYCTARGNLCLTTPTERKPRQVKKKKNDNLSGLENRLQRMESLLVASGLDASQPKSDPSAHQDPEKLSERLSTLVINDESGATHFWGPSSAISLFSPRGLQWIEEKTGTYDMQNFMADLAKDETPDAFARISSLCSPIHPSQRAPIPPREVADCYIQCFFGFFNKFIPLFDQHSFMQLYEQQYSSRPPPGASWYAALNIVFAIGSTGGALDGLTPTPELNDCNDPWSCSGFFRNSCSVLMQLLLSENSLLCVQALLGICIVLESSLDPQSSYTVAAAATRVAHTIGLHKSISRPGEHGVSERHSLQRCNVFWVMYIIDKSIALRIGRPPMIHDDDIDIDLPECRNEPKSSQNEGEIDIFYYHITLSKIQSKIYSELYTVQSQKKPIGKRLESIAQIDQKLQKWRDNLPPPLQPGQPLSCRAKQTNQVIMLQFAYYNCVNTLHRASSLYALWIKNPAASSSSDMSQNQMQDRLYASQLHCIRSARSTAELVALLKQQGSYSRSVLARLGIFYLFGAFAMLFSNILQNPTDPCVEADRCLMDVIADYLSKSTTAINSPAAIATKIFQKLNHISAQFLANRAAQNRGTKRARRNSELDTSTWQSKDARDYHESSRRFQSTSKAGDTNPVQLNSHAGNPSNFFDNIAAPAGDMDSMGNAPFVPLVASDFTPDFISTSTWPFFPIDFDDFDNAAWNTSLYDGADYLG